MCSPAGTSRSARAEGTCLAARRIAASSRSRTTGSCAFATRATIRKLPSLRSPKCSVRIVRTRSESVPGTRNSFERSGASRAFAAKPSRSTTAQTASTGTRCRSTKRVQRSISRRLPAARGLPGANQRNRAHGGEPHVGRERDEGDEALQDQLDSAHGRRVLARYASSMTDRDRIQDELDELFVDLCQV